MDLAVPAYEVPLWKKLTLTFEEAAIYSGLGINKIRLLASLEDCPFALKNGAHTIIKRTAFENFINSSNSI